MDFIIYCVIILSLLTICRAKVDSTLVKTYEEPDRYRTRIYSDGKEVVMGLFDDDDRLVDCAYQRQNVTLVAAVFHDVSLPIRGI